MSWCQIRTHFSSWLFSLSSRHFSVFLVRKCQPAGTVGWRAAVQLGMSSTQVSILTSESLTKIKAGFVEGLPAVVSQRDNDPLALIVIIPLLQIWLSPWTRATAPFPHQDWTSIKFCSFFTSGWQTVRAGIRWVQVAPPAWHAFEGSLFHYCCTPLHHLFFSCQ